MLRDLVRRRVAAAALVAATTLTAGLTLVTAPTAAAEGCPDIEVVFARGTTEAPGLGLVGGSFVSDLRGKVGGRSVGAYAVNYPASYDFLAAANGANDASAHIQYMRDFAARLEATGEYVDGQALAPEGEWVRYDGEGRPPVTDGPFAETKDLIAGWMIIDVDTYDRAVELAGELSAAPGAGGKPIHEWLEVRPFYGVQATATE